VLFCRFCEEVCDQGAVADRGEDAYELYLVSRIPELKLNSRMYISPYAPYVIDEPQVGYWMTIWPTEKFLLPTPHVDGSIIHTQVGADRRTLRLYVMDTVKRNCIVV